VAKTICGKDNLENQLNNVKAETGLRETLAELSPFNCTVKTLFDRKAENRHGEETC